VRVIIVVWATRVFGLLDEVYCYTYFLIVATLLRYSLFEFVYLVNGLLCYFMICMRYRHSVIIETLSLPYSLLSLSLSLARFHLHACWCYALPLALFCHAESKCGVRVA
jgi:hypothetical protein